VANGREAIVLAAERLIALRGAEVPARDIAQAAGQRNNSAVQYHFASREDLVAAVLELRAPVLEEHRMERLVELERTGMSDDARALVAVMVLPLLDAPLVDGSWHYARVLQQAWTTGAVDGATVELHRGSVALVFSRLEALMPPLSKAARQARIEAFGTTLFALAAEHERKLEAGLTGTRRAIARDAIIDALTGVLLAPAPSVRSA
jgi:AcrR family transcriptional regulator